MYTSHPYGVPRLEERSFLGPVRGQNKLERRRVAPVVGQPQLLGPIRNVHRYNQPPSWPTTFQTGYNFVPPSRQEFRRVSLPVNFEPWRFKVDPPKFSDSFSFSSNRPSLATIPQQIRPTLPRALKTDLSPIRESRKSAYPVSPYKLDDLSQLGISQLAIKEEEEGEEENITFTNIQADRSILRELLEEENQAAVAPKRGPRVSDQIAKIESKLKENKYAKPLATAKPFAVSAAKPIRRDSVLMRFN